MKGQKSMGQFAVGLWTAWAISQSTESALHYTKRLAKEIIAEHERRKRAPCSDCQHVGSGSCKSCRYWMATHTPSYFERKCAKSKKDKK